MLFMLSSDVALKQNGINLCKAFHDPYFVHCTGVVAVLLLLYAPVQAQGNRTGHGHHLIQSELCLPWVFSPDYMELAKALNPASWLTTSWQNQPIGFHKLHVELNAVLFFIFQLFLTSSFQKLDSRIFPSCKCQSTVRSNRIQKKKVYQSKLDII